MAHKSWKNFFLYKPLLLLSSINWPFSLCKILLKNSYSGYGIMRMHNFWLQNGPFAQMRIFLENLLMSLVPFIHAYLHDKNQSHIIICLWILLIKEYWNLIGREPFWAITWESDFSQACSFHRMLMNHKKFNFTQIPDKTNDMIYLKGPKNLFWGHFWPFLVILAPWGKNRDLSHAKN